MNNFVNRSRSIKKEDYSKLLNSILDLGRQIVNQQFPNDSALFTFVYKALSEYLEVQSLFYASYDKSLDLVKFQFAIEEGVVCRTGRGDWKARKKGNGLTEYIINNKLPALFLKGDIQKWMDDHEIEVYGRMASSFVGLSIAGNPYLEGITGIIGIQNYQPGYEFSKYQRDIFIYILPFIELALKNIRLFQYTNNYLDSTNQFIQKTSSKLVKSELINEIINQINTKLGCTHCSIFFVKRKGQYKYLSAEYIGIKQPYFCKYESEISIVL